MFQAVWRTLAAGGLWAVWFGATQPIWILRESNQVVILGTHLLSAQAIRSILPLSYPKSLPSRTESDRAL
jgi:cell division protein FtsQ